MRNRESPPSSIEPEATTLRTLNEERMRLYRLYREKRLDREEYLERLRPLDEMADRIEMAILIDHASSEKEPSKRS
ncbi:hypothetical protein [Hydrogenimonas sp.]